MDIRVAFLDEQEVLCFEILWTILIVLDSTAGAGIHSSTPPKPPKPLKPPKQPKPLKPHA